MPLVEFGCIILSMNSKLRERIKNELLPKINLKENFEFSGKSYEIIEECDLYGFSCLKHQYQEDSERKEDERPNDLIQEFKNDESWFNPSAVELMMQSYQIDEPYASFDPTRQKNLAEKNYLTIKAEQRHLLSNRVVEEGMILLQHSQIAESIKKFTIALSYDNQNAEAYFSRGNAYFRLREWASALSDANNALKYNPSCLASKELKRAIEQHYHQPSASDLAQMLLDQEGPRDNFQSNNVLIDKLRNSLANDRESRVESDDNDRRKSESDEESTDSSRRSKKKSKKRKKKHKKHKSHKKRKSDSHKD